MSENEYNVTDKGFNKMHQPYLFLILNKGDIMNNQYAPPQSNVADGSYSNAAAISNTMIEAMGGTKPWVLLIGVVLFISAAFMLLGTLGMVGAGSLGMAQMGVESGVIVGIGAMYGLMSVIYIMMGIYLIKYSSAIGRLLQSASAVDMEEALIAQRKFWKIAGIITAVMLVVMLIGIVAAIVIPFLTMAR